MAGSTVVFLHAHPDDEAIFTGGTMRLLASAGCRVVLVVATDGEAGSPRLPLSPGERLAAVRARETRTAAGLLGVDRVVFLGYGDSGARTGPAPPGSFGAAGVAEAAARLAQLCVEERADALTSYDRGGIYAHLDHLQVHRVGAMAAELAGIATLYEATVDHEYLHFVDVHLVEGASRSVSSLSAPPQAPARAAALARAERARVGLPTAEITTVADVRSCLDVKRAAMAAHASQIPEADLSACPERFAAVYGYEWFVRRGPRGPIEAAGLTDWGPIPRASMASAASLR